jgi:threonine dehydratase
MNGTAFPQGPSSAVAVDPPHADFDLVLRAAQALQGVAHRTPVLTSSTFDALTQAEVHFKCENFQRVGAFKFRGAWFAIRSLPQDKLDRGVVTHSSGNHGQAVALAARMSGAKAWVVMPENAPRIKREAVAGYGAEVILCPPTLSGREHALQEVVDRTGAVFIPPFNDPHVIAGQGTAAKEFHEQVPGLDIMMSPVGGGGLLSGTAIATRALAPSCMVIGAEPELADDAARSMATGVLQRLDSTPTIADGLRASLGPIPFSIIRHHVDRIVTVSEASILEAMRWVWERMNIIIEPSCAVPVAALMQGKLDAKGRRIGIILTGGNVDLDRLPWQSTGAGP